MHELDRDTQLSPAGEGAFETRISDAWGIYGNPNGGYLAALMGRALAQALPHPDPLTLTTHYVARAIPGAARIEVEIVRAGRNHSTGVARLLQEGKERLRTIATFGDLGAHSGQTHEEDELPPIPLEACEARRGPPGGSTFGDRVEARYAPGTTAFLDAVIGSRMEIGGWMRLRDGREPDANALLLFADAMPPPALHAMERVYIPTIELTVHVRRRPSPGWLRAWFSSRALIDDYVEEDGRLWDSAGRLVAMSRQLSLVQRTGR